MLVKWEHVHILIATLFPNSLSCSWSYMLSTEEKVQPIENAKVPSSRTTLDAIVCGVVF